MLKERVEFIRQVFYVIDLLILSATFFLVYYLFFHFSFVYSRDFFPQIQVVKKPHSIDLYLRAYWVILCLWAVILRVRGEYHIRVQTYGSIVTGCLLNGLLFFGAFTSIAFIFKMDFVSRMFMAIYTVAGVSAVLLGKLLTLLAAFYVRSHGLNYRNLLLVGTGKRAQDFIELVAKHKEWGYRFSGIIDQEPGRVGQSVKGHKVIGILSDLPDFLQKNVVDEVVFVVPRDWLKEIEKSILCCEAVGVPATLSTDFFDLEIAQGVPREMDGLTYLTFETRQLRDPELLAKRPIDITFSSLILILMSPILAGIVIAIKLDSKGPVFFKQTRCGRNGRQFILYKFRSMVPGAEERLEELRAMNEMSGPVFKMEKDPRVTRIGRVLRKTSLDEFPQFWNVLKGDMSIVGPRPPIPGEVEKYESWQRRRLSMKPGITCIWQVSGRNKIGFEDWMKMDLQYIDRWSIWLDTKIFFQTILVVLTGHGAK